MGARITCPHCRQVLTSRGPVAAGRQVHCPGCRRVFVTAGGPQLVGSVAPARTASRPRHHAQERPNPRDGNGAAVGVVLGAFGVFLAIGVGLAWYAASIPADDPPPNEPEIAQLPAKKEAPQSPAAEQLIEAVPAVPEIPEEKVGAPRPTMKVPKKFEKPRPTLTPEVQRQIDDALRLGVAFLTESQQRNGTWTGNLNHPVGATSLPALTLLECGVRKEDARVQLAAKAVRGGAARLNQTYDLALAILFLDKLADAQDRKLIQSLAMRLVAGQNYAGGWSYQCNALGASTSQELLAFLQKERQRKLDHPDGKLDLANPLGLSAADLGRAPPKAPDNPPAREKTPAKVKEEKPPASVRLLPIFNPVGSGPKFRMLALLGDNSNTQFALLGLWVARRYDIPLERTFALAEVRFRRLQNADGGWGYVGEHGNLLTTDSMTCVGLLGLAIGRGSEYELLHLGKAMHGATVQKLTTKDEGIQKGLKRLGKSVGEPTGRTTDLQMQKLYYLWSVQRVAVLYNLPTMGDRDWYLWGAETLLANQQANGCWDGLGFPGTGPINNTCFGLLFLKRADLSPELGDRLRLYIPVVDPDRRTKSEDNQGPRERTP